MLSTRSVQKILFLSLLLACGSLAFSASDEPDLRKEKRLHQTYQRFNQKPTSVEDWRGATSGKSMNYQIQQADTLWDMSEVLFGDPGFWPKIWSLNSEKIENPHEIFPGQTIKFSSGTLAEPPSLAVAKPGEAATDGSALAPAAPLAEIKAEKSAAAETEEEIPASDPKNQELLALAGIPPEPPPRPVTQFPSSIPKWSFGKRQQVLELQVVKIPRNFSPTEEPLAFFVTEEVPASVGTITEGEMGQSTLAEYQYLFVRLEPGTTQKRLVVMKEQEEIVDRETKTTAKVMQVQGEIEVLEVVNTEENIHRAMVKKIVSPIQVGAMLVADSLPKFRAKTETMGAGVARVIGGQHSAQRRLIEPVSLVYLMGTGLTEGQSYPVYKQQVLRQSKTQSFENPLKIGTVKVVKVSNQFATGVVIEEREEIHVGDVTDPHMRTLK